MTASAQHAQTIIAGMGELKVVTCPAGERIFLKTTVGSCIGLFVADLRNSIFGLAHIMLPSPIKDDGVPGKYADTALPELTRLMTRGGRPPSLKAYIVGGASMFGTPDRSFVADIGSKNVEAVLAVIRQHQVPVVYEETGGNQGRTAIYDCANDSIDVRKLANPGFVASGSTGE